MNSEPNQITVSPDYETKSQVARRLNVSRRTVDNLMRQRRLPFIKLTTKIVRFPNAEVDAYLARPFCIRVCEAETGKRILKRNSARFVLPAPAGNIGLAKRWKSSRPMPKSKRAFQSCRQPM